MNDQYTILDITLSESCVVPIHDSSCVSTHIKAESAFQKMHNPSEFIDSRIQAAMSDMKTKLSAMTCTGCGGNINPQTLYVNVVVDSIG